ncbi:MAG: NADH:flavin oxidoreductase [Deltaproteobacteria bacterium]|nr:NADH:flavin oxidoreductase [Deltaproteobacteria bacterium]
MSVMFETTAIKGMTLKNRFVRSATWEGMAGEDGACTPKLLDLMGELAKGGLGMIITSHAYVQKEGQAGPWQLGIYDDRFMDGLRKMADTVHAHDSRVVIQLAHAGFFANPKLTGQTPLAPSNVEGLAKGPRRELQQDEIREIVGAFGEAARRARSAGFDGVQIHAAHGYLLSQFLSPAFNKRQDEYGGPVENRAKAALEVLQSVRGAVGEDFPVLIKMNCQDFVEDGLPLEDTLKVGVLLEQGGLDAIELSGGTMISGKFIPSRGGIKTEEKEAYFRDSAKALKEKVGIPLILVGGNRSFNVGERLVQEGYADYISMSRPLIREPHLIQRWADGDFEKARCLSDNQCFGPAMAGKGIYCVVEEKENKKE